MLKAGAVLLLTEEAAVNELYRRIGEVLVMRVGCGRLRTDSRRREREGRNGNRIVRRIIIKKGRTSMGHNTQLGEEIRKHQDAIVKDWMAYQMSSLTLRRDLVKESELRESSRQFLVLFGEARATSDDTSVAPLEGGEGQSRRDFAEAGDAGIQSH